MKNKIFLSTTCFSSKNLIEILNTCRTNQILNLEISGNINYLNDRSLKNLFDQYEDINLRFHNYFPVPKNHFVLNLAHKETKEKSLINLIKGGEYSKNYGGNIFSFHAGLRFNPKMSSLGSEQKKYESTSYDESYKILEQSIIKLQNNNKNKIKLCIENNVVENYNKSNSKSRYIFSDLSDKQYINHYIKTYKINILLDFAHLKVSSNSLNFDPYEFIDEYKNSIIIAHISDNDGLTDSSKKITKKSWFWKTINWKKLNYISLEVKNYNINELKKQVDTTLEQISKN